MPWNLVLTTSQQLKLHCKWVKRALTRVSLGSTIYCYIALELHGDCAG